MPRLEIAFARWPGKTVPWTDHLAVVAAEHPIADQRPEFFGNRAFEFDGQVGDAAAGIQHIGPHEGIGRADVQASGAAAAVLGGVGRVFRQGQVDEQLAEKEVAAGFAVQYQGVLANPAQAGLFGDRFLEHRSAVDESAIAEGADDRLNFFCQLLHTFTDQFVVIAAQRIARDISFLRLCQALGHFGVARQVVHAQGNHSKGAGY